MWNTYRAWYLNLAQQLAESFPFVSAVSLKLDEQVKKIDELVVQLNLSIQFDDLHLNLHRYHHENTHKTE